MDEMYRQCPVNSDHIVKISKIHGHVSKCKECRFKKILYCKKDNTIMFLEINEERHFENCKYCYNSVFNKNKVNKSNNKSSNISISSIKPINNDTTIDLCLSESFNDSTLNNSQSIQQDIKYNNNNIKNNFVNKKVLDGKLISDLYDEYEYNNSNKNESEIEYNNETILY